MRAPTTVQWIRRAGQRLSTGSVRLATHLAARALDKGCRIWNRGRDWLAEASGVAWLLRLGVLLAVAWILRKILAAIATGLYLTVANGGRPWLMWGVALAWVIGGYRCGHPDWKPKPRLEAEQDAPADEGTRPPPPNRRRPGIRLSPRRTDRRGT